MTLTVEHTTMPVLGRLPIHSSRAEQVAHIAEAAKQIRIQDLKLVHHAGAGHIGGDFSAIDILATLYFAVLESRPETARRPGARPVYPEQGPRRRRALHHAGDVRLLPARRAGDLRAAALRPEWPPQPHQGPGGRDQHRPARPWPAGGGRAALSAKMDGSSRRTFVLVGDGELQEGSNWEAAMAAAHYQLDNLTVIVDRNRLQQGAFTERDQRSRPAGGQVARRLASRCAEVERPRPGELLDGFRAVPFQSGKPTFVIAHTHKGHGVSFMERQVGGTTGCRTPTESARAVRNSTRGAA